MAVADVCVVFLQSDLDNSPLAYAATAAADFGEEATDCNNKTPVSTKLLL